jgi:hypothetical protein
MGMPMPNPQHTRENDGQYQYQPQQQQHQYQHFDQHQDDQYHHQNQPHTGHEPIMGQYGAATSQPGHAYNRGPPSAREITIEHEYDLSSNLHRGGV